MSKNMKYVLFIASGILAFTVYIDGAQRMAVKDLAEVTVSGEGKNITQVLVDEKAKTDILKSNASAVYCLLEKCSSWGGVRYKPAVYAGVPEDPELYRKFRDNGIDVYIKKGLSCPGGTIKITLSSFFRIKKLTVKGLEN